MKVSQLKKNKANPRQIKGEKLELLKKSVGSFQKMMELRPMIVDENFVVLGGNMRLAAIKALGLKEIPDSWVRQVTDLTEDEKKEFIIKDNNSFGEYDWDAIANEWSDLPLADWGLDVPGFEALEDEGETAENVKPPTLADRFLIPPFSVLDARQGYWQDRKRVWIEIGIESELGRGDDCITYSPAATIVRNNGGVGFDGSKVYKQSGNGLLGISQQARSHYSGLGAVANNENGANGILTRTGKYATGSAKVFGTEGNASEQSGTSIFDPVLCEIIYRWFAGEGFSILDPFAGGSVRGIVASKLNRKYTGIELRPEQIEANAKQAKAICKKPEPKWIEGDSRDIDALAPNVYDLLFSCPPYADLEVYSDDPRDISTMSYADFIKAYRQIISKSCEMLKENRFACFVVGEVRDKKGIYRNFVSDTIQAFQDAGLKYYNEAILVTSVGSLPIRVGRQFESGRKVGKTHQNVLVFVKGDGKKAAEACGKVEVYDPAEAFGEIA